MTADLGRRRALRLLGGAAALPFIAPCRARGGGQAGGTGAPAVRPSGHPISSVVRCPVSKVGDARFDGFTASWNGCVRASPAAVVHARTAEDLGYIVDGGGAKLKERAFEVAKGWALAAN